MTRRNVTLDDLRGPARVSAVQQISNQVMDKARGAQGAVSVSGTQKSVPARIPDPASFTLHLPIPPSTNNLFKSVGNRRVRSVEYEAWSRVAGQEIQAQRAPQFAGPVRVDIACERPERLSDIDNRIKAPLDALVKFHVLRDDSQVVEVRCRWADVTGCVVVITSIGTPLAVSIAPIPKTPAPANEAEPFNILTAC